MNKKAITVSGADNVMSIEEHVKKSEILKSNSSSIIFDYKLNDKSSKTKLLKAAKRIPISVEETKMKK